MNVDIYLGNTFFPWNKTENNNIKCWLKGDLFYNNKILNGSDVISLYSSISYDSKNINDILKDFLLGFNGSFALVIETTDNILCVVDRVRSIPLFYSINSARLTISDDANYIKDHIFPSLNEINCAEFLVTGYVTGSETLFDGIWQIQSGEFLFYTKYERKISVYRYFSYLHGDYSDETEEQLIKRLDKVIVSVFNRLIDTTIKQGKVIVVPLSGGLDSRLIVSMLKRLGVKDVICFSYGRKKNREAEISKRVAEALGYPWYFVEYSNKKWYDFYNSDEMRAYEQYAGNLASLPVIQDFLAVKILKEEGKLPDNAVFVPGHSGDFLAGSYIPLDYNATQNFSIETFLKETRKKHYFLWEWDYEAKKNSVLNQKIKSLTNEILICDSESYVTCVNFFVFSEKVAKFVVNSVRLYEFFGYGWRIPLWDTELMDFFLHTPLYLRLNQDLYIKYAFNEVFKEELKILSQIPCTTSKESLSQESLRTYIFRIIPLSPIIKRKIFLQYKIKTEYSSHPLNWHSIMSEDEFKSWYSGYQTINSFLTKKYLKRFTK